MAKIVDQEILNDNRTYVVKINEVIFKHGLFHYKADVEDEEKVKRCSLFLNFIRDVMHDDGTSVVQSLQIEKTDSETIFTMESSSSDGFTDIQLGEIITIIHQRIQPGLLENKPLISELELFAYEQEKRESRDEFTPNQALKKTNPALFEAENALYYALEPLLPGIRKDGGDVIPVEIKKDEIDICVSGACVGCPSSFVVTMRKLFDDIRFGYSQAQHLQEKDFVSLNVFDENGDWVDPTYSIRADGIYDRRGARQHVFSQELAPMPR